MRKTHPAPARAPYTPRTTDLRFASLCDEEVAARALSGDAAAFGVLMARHGSKVYRRALRILANPCDAEDATQDTFLNAYRALASFHGEAKFATWLHRIAVNAALMRRRAAKRRPTVSLDDAGGFAMEGHASGAFGERRAVGADEVAQTRELGRELSHAILALDEPYREIFVLREVDGVSTEEAANKLGLSVPLARQRLHRARLALRNLAAPLAPGAEDATTRAA